MKIKDVQIDGFGVWSGLTVHSMPDTMTVFYGPNEAGKTTLMNFLRTMFYGFTTDRRQRYLPPVYGGKPGGAVRVTGPGGGYEICRRAQLDQGGATGSLSVTGSDGLAQGAHRLTMLLGQVDESIFTNVFAIGLRELQELSTLDDTAAADELYKLSSGLDRVSLVDVARQLKAGRQSVVGPSPDKGQMQFLMLKREQLNEEIDSLTAQGRRWSELAALRKTQNVELDELKERISQWQLEAKTYEVAVQVRPTWNQRANLTDRIEALGARTDLPDSVAEKLEQLAEQREEREEKIKELKMQRRELRKQASELPLRKGILELASKIEAATEQSPWIASMQKTIQRVEGQIESTKLQLVEDAKRLGVTEDDQQALLGDRDLEAMPDLSRQAINSLVEPAGEVRMWTNRLKQAKDQLDSDEKDVERLEAELAEASTLEGDEEIEEAMQRHSETVSLIRKRMHVQEILDQQNARRKQLEENAIDLQCDEALPIDRAFMVALPFIFGAFAFLWGLGMLIPVWGGETNPNGLAYVVCGMCALFVGLLWSTSLDRSNTTDLEEVEGQIDAIRKEIRKTEADRDDYDRRLPPYSGTLEHRLKQVEGEIDDLENMLPIQHNYQAATERTQSGKRRVKQASESLQKSKTEWSRLLRQLGLAESLSPKSIRIMAESYDALLQTRRKLHTLEEELESRQLELGAITQRIEGLSRQAFAAKAVGAIEYESDDETHDEESELESEEVRKRDARAAYARETVEEARADIETANRALDQLTELNALIASQEEFIHKKRQLKEEDSQLAKQCATVQKAIDKIDRVHSALLAEHGCETEEQLIEQLELKHEHEELVSQLKEFEDRIQALVGGNVPYETIGRLMETGGNDLEQRWTAIGQRIQQAEERVEQLIQRQGELAQEMKTLAANSRLAEARLELSCVENELKACAEHWQTLAVTTGLLDKVCEVYEAERQPETLREASAFLTQLTEGKYVRIWTPLGKNQLRIDSAKGQSLPLEVLSRGTREAVFIALRLSLAAAYARRGVTIPLVLDDVLVNFDSVRAESAAKVLRDYAALGHQVVMFTCHEHIMRIFHEIGVQVRVLPTQGEPGEAEIYYPERLIHEPEPLFEPEPVVEPEPIIEPEPILEPLPIVEPEPVMIEPEPEPEPEPVVIQAPSPKPKKKVRRMVVVEQEPEIDWLWYERNPDSVDWGWVEADERIDEKHIPVDLWWNRPKAEAS